MLDLPARDVMARPAEIIDLDCPLGQAATRMLDGTYSPLVVTSSDVTWPLGLVTTTDLLRASTWTEGDHTPVQVFLVHLLDDLSQETIAEWVDEIDRKYGAMDVLENKERAHPANRHTTIASTSTSSLDGGSESETLAAKRRRPVGDTESRGAFPPVR